ncbi:BatA domain-containing protein [Algoriphagus aestuarii]|nr:BatA domain-containing protein [Algoriphagus aestuarii]
MEILQPILLWGLLGLSIPLAIHLWNGKKGKNMAWAAMAWLSEQENQSSKSIRLDQILILCLRMALLVIFVLLLSQWVIKSWDISESKKVVHLVAPDRQVFEEFRFELDQANEREEQVIWLEGGLSEISEEPKAAWFTSTEIQNALNELEGNISELNLYLPNSGKYLSQGMLISPIQPKIHLAKTVSVHVQNTQVEIDSAKILELGEEGVLVSKPNSASLKPNVSLKQVGFSLGNLEKVEKDNVRAGFNSISQVMGIYFIEGSPEDAQVIFNRGKLDTVESGKLYFFTETVGFPESKNVSFIPSKLDFESSEMLQSGHFPEFLLRKLIGFAGVYPLDTKVSENQVASRFLVSGEKTSERKSGFDILLVGLFVLLFGAERYMSFQRGV